METSPAKLNSRKIFAFLGLIFCWVLFTFGLLYMTSIGPDSLAVRLVIMGLYSLTPLASAVIVDRRFIKKRVTVPKTEYGWVLFFLLPMAAFFIFLAVVMTVTYIFGNMLHIHQIGMLATSTSELVHQFSSVILPEQLKSVIEVNSVMFVYILTIGGAILMGWTIYGLFGFGEEYGWRGFLWDELKGLGVIQANLLIGLVWGLWHAPLVLQGLNYSVSGWLGMLAIVGFTISTSFVLSALREKTQSVVPAALVHGMVNGSIYIATLLFIVSDPLVGGLSGVIASSIMLIIGIVVWLYLSRRQRKARAI